MGYTVIVKDVSGPMQPLKIAETFIVAIIESTPVTVAAETGMEPLPAVPNPISLSQVHAN